MTYYKIQAIRNGDIETEINLKDPITDNDTIKALSFLFDKYSPKELKQEVKK